MNLNAVKELLKNINQTEVSLIEVVQSDTKANFGPVVVVEIDNILAFNQFLKKIENIKSFSSEVGFFRKSEIANVFVNKIKLQKAHVNHCLEKQGILWFKIKMLLEIAEEFAPTIRENTIAIKLPDKSDFVDVAKSVSQIQKSMTQIIVHPDIGGYPQVDSFEHGSLWINICVGSAMAVSLVGSATWSAVVIQKKMTENKILEEVLKSKQLSNEHLSAVVEANKKELDNLLDIEAQHVYKECYKQIKDVDHELIIRIRESIKVFSELIEQGAEIHPALMAPEKASNLFPDFKAIGTVESKVKQIENKKN